jgi:hypothetical protein
VDEAQHRARIASFFSLVFSLTSESDKFWLNDIK